MFFPHKNVNLFKTIVLSDKNYIYINCVKLI